MELSAAVYNQQVLLPLLSGLCSVWWNNLQTIIWLLCVDVFHFSRLLN